MSHYISTFLIDPVVRQARRFSRPSYDGESPHATTQRALRSNGVEAPPVDENDKMAAAAAATQEIQHYITYEHEGDHFADVTGDFEVLTPEAEELVPQLQAWTPRQEVALPLRRAETAPEVYTRMRPGRHYTRYTVTDTDINTSNNPSYSIPDSLHSTLSSASGSESSAIETIMISGDYSTLSSRTAGQDAGLNNYRSRMVDGSLPADDGMGHMRNKILAIQGMEITSAEKARFIHEIMTERYTSSQSSLQASHSRRPRSPASLLSSVRPFTPISSHSLDKTAHSASTIAESTSRFQLTLEDLRPSYFSKRIDDQAALGGNMRTEYKNRESSEHVNEPRPLGCPHYKRNIKLQCSACDRWYTCRFCHDEVEDHSLNRKETKNMLCMLCGCAQPASEECAQCGERGAWYYCGVCKLWDDDPNKSIYHCHDCGICRVGQGLGKDFYHCKVVPLLTAIDPLRSSNHLSLDLLCMSLNLNSRHAPLHRALYRL